jgi:hypothetical protein
MKILNQAVVLTANRYEQMHHYREEQISYTERVRGEPADELDNKQRRNRVTEIKSENRRAVKKDQYSSSKVIDKTLEGAEDEPYITNLKTRVMKQVLESFTGIKIKLYKELGESEEIAETVEKAVEENAPPKTIEFTIERELYETHYEKEAVAFSAIGNVSTEDGRKIAFNATLKMSREFYSENYEKSTTTGEYIDPIVINLDDRGVQLENETVQFDLNGDGKKEDIHNLTSGSGFLALDRNGDGKINDGNELFGPQSGDGFADLSKLDSDKNGWIDESDELFYELRIWRPSEEGVGESLLASDVGAIYLNSVKGEFSLKDEDNNLNGVVKEQGIYLKESSGEAGFVQEIDLVA